MGKENEGAGEGGLQKAIPREKDRKRHGIGDVRTLEVGAKVRTIKDSFHEPTPLALWPTNHVLNAPTCLGRLPSVGRLLEVKYLGDESLDRHRP